MPHRLSYASIRQPGFPPATPVPAGPRTSRSASPGVHEAGKLQLRRLLRGNNTNHGFKASLGRQEKIALSGWVTTLGEDIQMGQTHRWSQERTEGRLSLNHLFGISLVWQSACLMMGLINKEDSTAILWHCLRH